MGRISRKGGRRQNRDGPNNPGEESIHDRHFVLRVFVFSWPVFMLKVALTGGIATGKSHVLEQFRRRGVPCLDADLLAHGVTAAGTEASSAIAARFGQDVLAADGSVDRARLAPIVFADPAARRELEAMVHPAVYRAIRAGLRAFELELPELAAGGRRCTAAL